VKTRFVLGILIAGCCSAPAQTNDMDVGDLLDSAQQWAQANLDDDVLRALQDVDRQKVEDFLNRFQDYLNGDEVLDLAQLKEAANSILPLLAAHEETQPYAAWLRARLDYFDAVDALISALPETEPGKPSPPRLNPPFAAEREIWIKKVAPRPWPKTAQEYMPKLKPVFTSEGVPPALAWVAEVESSFDPHARSPAGAVGLFQLMPPTAKQYGLSLWPRDQRRQTEVSAHAAAKYLRQLYLKFGDWRLAIAAYNSGEGKVEKLLQRYKTDSYENIATHLPAETQLFVPKVEATVLHREGVELTALPAPEPQ